MKTSKGFDQCYNAQIAVNDDRLLVGNYVNAHPNDKQEFLPTIESVPDELKPKITSAVADTGYYSQQNIKNCPKTITPITWIHIISATLLSQPKGTLVLF